MMRQRPVLSDSHTPLTMPLPDKSSTTIYQDAELDELFFDFTAASSGEACSDQADQQLTGLPPQSYATNELLWSTVEGENGITPFDFLSSSGVIRESEENFRADILSASSLQSSPFSESPSIMSTPDAVFSTSTTDTLSLPEDLEYQHPMDDFQYSYILTDELETNYNSPALTPLSDLPNDWQTYCRADDERFSLSPTDATFLPSIRIDPPSQEMAEPLESAGISSVSTAFDWLTTNGDSPLSCLSPDDVFTVQDLGPNTSIASQPGPRRSSRSSRKVGTYREPDESDDSSSGGQSASSSPRAPKRRLDDNTYDDSERESSPGSSTLRSNKGPSRSTRRRKAMNLSCTIGSCTQTFGRENDRKRHWLTASVHEADRPNILDMLNLSQSQSQCKICGEYLSRRDAQLRHVRDKSCGKRAGRRRVNAKAVMTAVAATQEQQS